MRCIRIADLVLVDCKFIHSSSRPSPKSHKPFGGKFSSTPYQRPTNGNVSSLGMNVSKKFGVAADKKLDPGAGAFKLPEGEKRVEVA